MERDEWNEMRKWEQERAERYAVAGASDIPDVRDAWPDDMIIRDTIAAGGVDSQPRTPRGRPIPPSRVPKAAQKLRMTKSFEAVRAGY